MPRLCPLFSGSKGNSYYIGSATEGILIDTGRNAKQIENALIKNNLSIKNVKSIFITHEHTDHIQGLRVLASKHKIKVYASRGTISALYEKEIINDKVDILPITLDGIETNSMNITPFKTSHDCEEGFGYVVETSDGRKTAFATDTGYITDSMKKALKGCDTVVIESNHDVRMLENGDYPYLLKRRILSNIGHLSNDTCANSLADMINNGTTRFFLAHLSSANNIPELALQTSLCALESKNMKQNIDFKIFVVPVENTKGSVIF